MAVIIGDNSIYLSLDEPLRMGQHRGVQIGTVIEEFPDYIQYLLDNKWITLAGECEETYRLQMIKLENAERDGEQYTDDFDPFEDTFGESLADYL